MRRSVFFLLDFKLSSWGVVNEKKETSEPDIKPDKTNSTTIAKKAGVSVAKSTGLKSWANKLTGGSESKCGELVRVG